MNQPNLFDQEPPESPEPRDQAEKLFREFRAFLYANPLVYFELRRLTFDLVDRGRKHYGMSGLFAVLRWHRARLQRTDQEFKINDHHSPFYARLLMAQHPDKLGRTDADDGEGPGFFRIRKRAGKSARYDELMKGLAPPAEPPRLSRDREPWE